MRVLRIDQPRTIDELSLRAHECVVELPEILGGDAEIRIQDHENVATSLGKSQTHGIAFALTLLDQDRDVFLGFARSDPPTLFEGVICRMTLNKDELCMGPQRRESTDERLDVPRLVAARA